MEITTVRGRRRRVLNSMKIHSQNHSMYELLPNQPCSGKKRRLWVMEIVYFYSRPMYFVQLTIDEHTVDEIRWNEVEKSVDLGCSRDVNHLTSWSTCIIG